MRLRLTVGDLVAKLRGPLADLRGTCAVLYFVLVDVVEVGGELEVDGELGVVGQRLVLGVVLVQAEVVVVGYVGVGLDRGYVASWPRLARREVQLRAVAGVAAAAAAAAGVAVGWSQLDAAGRGAVGLLLLLLLLGGELLAEPLVEGAFAVQPALELGYPGVDRGHLVLALYQGQALLRDHLVLLLVHLVAVLVDRETGGIVSLGFGVE